MKLHKWVTLLGMCCLVSACGGAQTIKILSEAKMQVPREKKAEKEVVAQEQERLQQPDTDQPARITSDHMQYREKGRVTVFNGNVCVNQGEAWLYSPYLEVRSEKGMAYARRGVRMIDHGRGITATAKEMDYNRDMTDVLLRENVDIATHDDGGMMLKIYCDAMRWNENEDAAIAEGHVTVHYKDTTATAHTMTYRRLEKMMILAGDKAAPKEPPVILQGTNTITGDIISLHIKDRIYEVEGSAKAIVLPQSDSENLAERKP